MKNERKKKRLWMRMKWSQVSLYPKFAAAASHDAEGTIWFSSAFSPLLGIGAEFSDENDFWW